MSFSVSLIIPPDAEFESLVYAVVDDCTSRAELAAQMRESVRIAARAAFSLIVRDTMAESRDPLRLRVDETHGTLAISITEHGLPIDAREAARDPQWNEVLEHADRAAWHWHATSGTTLTLTFFHRPTSTAQAPAQTNAPVQPAPEQTYTVRRFVPADAHAVARCFFATYGHTYVFPAVYEPRCLCGLNKSEAYVSFVAIDQNGEVAAHYALHREPGAPIAEGCGAAVDPQHRRRHLLEMLRTSAEEYARGAGLSAYYTEPVTDHPVTQLESQKFGACITAISLGHSPQALLAKHMDGLTATSQRQSLTLYVKLLRTAESRTVYPPANHRDILARLYGDLNIPIEMHGGAAPSGSGSLHVSVDKASQNSTIMIQRVGADSAAVAHQALADLVALTSLGAVYAMLPLEDPGTPALCEALENNGFFFSGLAPWMIDGRDALRLQFLLRPIDTTQLTIAGDAGQNLLAYIEGHRQTAAITTASSGTR